MPNIDFSDHGKRTLFEIVTGQSARWLVPVLYVVCGIAFIADLFRDSMLAYGIIYSPLIATAVFHKRRSGLAILTAVACILVLIGAFFPVVDPDLPDLIGNRVLSIAAILTTAAFVQHARDIQDRLAAETKRAEAAEQVKSQVLTELSQEIRTPLHSLLGVLTLSMADCKPELRRVLGQIKADGKELLATIDNLIDLTQLDRHELRQLPIDVATIARDATEGVTKKARERQVIVSMDGGCTVGETLVFGDSWATRTILDNLLANAVRSTPPGGTVSVSVSADRGSGTVTASVGDARKGLHPEAQDFHRDAPLSDGTHLPGMDDSGTALSRRLAQAMNGQLTARNQPGSGAVVSLSLPAI